MFSGPTKVNCNLSPEYLPCIYMQSNLGTRTNKLK